MRAIGFWQVVFGNNRDDSHKNTIDVIEAEPWVFPAVVQLVIVQFRSRVTICGKMVIGKPGDEEGFWIATATEPRLMAMIWTMMDHTAVTHRMLLHRR